MDTNRVRELLADVGSGIARLWGRASSRQRMIAGGCAVCLLAVTGTLTLMSFHSGQTLQRTVLVPTATLTATATATATNTPSPTATAKAVVKNVVQAPKPPPIPFNPPPPPAPTPTPTRAPTATAGPASTPGPTATPAPPTPTPTPCGPGAYQGGNPSQAQLRAAMQTAASTFSLPVNLVYSVAWEESRWHQDVVACDGGIGLMQIQGQSTATWINQQSVSACGLSATNYDMNTYSGNAMLGTKFLKWISCFYSFWGNNGGTSGASPGQYTIAWYYKNLGLQYPDTKNADGSTNANSYCNKIFTTSPENPALPSTSADPWSCPYNPQACTSGQGCDPNRIHNPDNTLLDATISAYNQGPGGFDNNGLQNHVYVSNVESYIPQFQSGALPVAS